jgi:hypothetical protein
MADKPDPEAADREYVESQLARLRAIKQPTAKEVTALREMLRVRDDLDRRAAEREPTKPDPDKAERSDLAKRLLAAADEPDPPPPEPETARPSPAAIEALRSRAPLRSERQPRPDPRPPAAPAPPRRPDWLEAMIAEREYQAELAQRHEPRRSRAFQAVPHPQRPRAGLRPPTDAMRCTKGGYVHCRTVRASRQAKRPRGRPATPRRTRPSHPSNGSDDQAPTAFILTHARLSGAHAQVGGCTSCPLPPVPCPALEHLALRCGMGHNAVFCMTRRVALGLAGGRGNRAPESSPGHPLRRPAMGPALYRTPSRSRSCCFGDDANPVVW